MRCLTTIECHDRRNVFTPFRPTNHQPQRKCLLNLGVQVTRLGTSRYQASNWDTSDAFAGGPPQMPKTDHQEPPIVRPIPWMS